MTRLLLGNDFGRVHYRETLSNARGNFTDENERPPPKRFGVRDRVGMPEIILAVPIAKRPPQGIDCWMATAIERQFAGERPPGPAYHRFNALCSKRSSDSIDVCR